MKDIVILKKVSEINARLKEHSKFLFLYLFDKEVSHLWNVAEFLPYRSLGKLIPKLQKVMMQIVINTYEISLYLSSALMIKVRICLHYFQNLISIFLIPNYPGLLLHILCVYCLNTADIILDENFPLLVNLLRIGLFFPDHRLLDIPCNGLCISCKAHIDVKIVLSQLLFSSCLFKDLNSVLCNLCSINSGHITHGADIDHKIGI